jgi:hypothetical protein
MVFRTFSGSQGPRGKMYSSEQSLKGLLDVIAKV